MKTQQKKFLAFGGLVANALIYCISRDPVVAVTGASAVGAATAAASGLDLKTPLLGLANAVSGNLASNYFSRFGSYADIVGRLSTPHPDDLNHDLERIIKMAAAEAMGYLKTLYLADLKKDDELWSHHDAKGKKEYLAAINKFFDQAMKDQQFKAGLDHISKTIIDHPEDYLNGIATFVLENSQINFDEESQDRFTDFYVARMPACFHLAFCEILKKDNVGFKAFQLWVFEEMKNDHKELLVGQKQILGKINRLRKSAFSVPGIKIKRLLERQTTQLYHSLDIHFRDFERTLLKTVNDRFRLQQNAINDGFRKQIEVAQSTQRILTDPHTGLKAMAKKMAALYDRISPAGAYTAAGRDQHKELPRKIGNAFKSDLFINRKNELNDIAAQFRERENIVVIAGEAGMGKTTLAARYWLDHQHTYRHMIWLKVDDSIARSVSSLHPYLDVHLDPQDSDAVKMDAVIRKLAEVPEPCLLVLDNANNKRDLWQHLHAIEGLSNFHVLITTWCNDLPRTGKVKLQHLDKSDALTLFKRHYAWEYKELPEKEVPIVERILKAVQYNTLVLEVLAKNLRQANRKAARSYSAARMLRELNKGLLKIKNEEKVTVKYHNDELIPATVHEIITAMYDMKLLSEEEIALLSNLALLPSDNITDRRLHALLVPEDLDSFGSLIEDLYQKGWLERDFKEHENSIKINPVVQQVVLKRNQTRIVADIDRYIRNLIDRLDRTGSEEAGRFADAARAVVEQVGITSELIGMAGLSLARHYHAVGNLLDAEWVLTKLVKAMHKTNLSDDLRYLAFYEFADVLEKIDKLGDADNYYAQARSLGPIDLYNYATFKSKIGKFSEAEPVIFRRYTELTAAPDPSIDTIKDRSVAAYDLATLLRKQVRLDEAMHYIEVALQVLDDLAQQTESDTLSRAKYGIVLHGKVQILLAMEKLDEAEATLDTVVEYLGAYYSSTHYYTGIIAGTLVNLYYKKIDAATAVQHRYRMLDILGRSIGTSVRSVFESCLSEAVYAWQQYGANLLSKEALLAHCRSLMTLMETQFFQVVNAFGVCNPWLHHCLSIAADTFSFGDDPARADFLRTQKQEFLRLTIARQTIDKEGFVPESIDESGQQWLMAEAVKQLPLPVTGEFPENSNIILQRYQLPFYGEHCLYEITIPNPEQQIVRYFLGNGKDSCHVIDYANDSIYAIGERDGRFCAENVIVYTRFFYDVVRGQKGLFYNLGYDGALPWRSDRAIAPDDKHAFEAALPLISPVCIGEGQFSFTGTTLFQNSLFHSVMTVDKEGKCSMSYERRLLWGKKDSKFYYHAGDTHGKMSVVVTDQFGKEYPYSDEEFKGYFFACLDYEYRSGLREIEDEDLVERSPVDRIYWGLRHCGGWGKARKVYGTSEDAPEWQRFIDDCISQQEALRSGSAFKPEVAQSIFEFIIKYETQRLESIQKDLGTDHYLVMVGRNILNSLIEALDDVEVMLAG